MTLHTFTVDKLRENPDTFGRQITEQIELELMLLNIHLRGLNEVIPALEGNENFAGIPRLENMSGKERKDLLWKTTVNNAFLSMFRNVVVYVDKLLSLYLFVLETKNNPIGPIHEIDNLEEYFESLPLEKYKELTRNQSFSFPKKVELIKYLEPRSKNRLLAYNNIRVAFEHHGGIVKKEIIVPLSKVKISSELKEGQKSEIRFDENDDMTIKENEVIELKSEQVSVIGLDIINFIIKDIQLSFGKMANEEGIHI